MPVPFWLGVILAAILYWRISVWLRLEDFIFSLKGAFTIMAIIVVLVTIGRML